VTKRFYYYVSSALIITSHLDWSLALGNVMVIGIRLHGKVYQGNKKKRFS
jgi:hypothetical protein